MRAQKHHAEGTEQGYVSSCMMTYMELLGLRSAASCSSPAPWSGPKTPCPRPAGPRAQLVECPSVYELIADCEFEWEETPELRIVHVPHAAQSPRRTASATWTPCSPS